MTSRALEAKHERILKELVRRPENKRCADCDTTGPSYAVTNFNTFVCTVCGGVHRQFGHRVKGITMATFKPDEIAALQAGGNQECHRFYLAKWEVKDLAKPVDRTPQKIKDWIEAVYVKKRYFSEDAPPIKPKSVANGTSAPPKPPTIEVPKGPMPSAGSITSPTGPAATAAAANAPFDPFNETTPPSTTTPNETAWADFGGGGLDTAATAAAPAPTPAAAAPQGWAAFGDAPSPACVGAAAGAGEGGAAAAGGVPAAPTPAPTPTPAAAAAAPAGWQAFGGDAKDGAAVAGGGGVGGKGSPTGAGSVGEAAKPPPPKELPLELFSEVQSLGIPGYAPPQPQYGAQTGYPPRPPAFATTTVHATAGYGAPPTAAPPPAFSTGFSNSYSSGSSFAGHAAPPSYAPPAPAHPPAAQYAGMPSPVSPYTGGFVGVPPTGAPAYAAASQYGAPVAAPQQQAYGGGVAYPGATAVPQGGPPADNFADLGPSFRAALPSGAAGAAGGNPFA